MPLFPATGVNYRRVTTFLRGPSRDELLPLAFAAVKRAAC